MENDFKKIQTFLCQRDFFSFGSSDPAGQLLTAVVDGFLKKDLTDVFLLIKAREESLSKMRTEYDNCKRSAAQKMEEYLSDLPSKEELKKMTKQKLFQLAKDKNVHLNKSDNKDRMVHLLLTNPYL